MFPLRERGAPRTGAHCYRWDCLPSRKLVVAPRPDFHDVPVLARLLIVLTFDHTRALYRVLYILLFSFGWSRAVRPIEPD